MGKIYVDEIEKSAEGTGIQLNSPLLNNSGNELLSAAGALSGNVDLSGAVFPAGGIGNPVSVAIIGDKKSSGSTGGGYTANAWSTRTLNFEAFDPDNIVSISNNNFILNAGSYCVDWWTTGFYCNSFFSRLYNVTDTSVVVYGSDGHASKNRSGVVDHTNSISLGTAFFTITSSKIFIIEFYPNAYDANNGGVEASIAVAGVDVYFTQVKIVKVK